MTMSNRYKFAAIILLLALAAISCADEKHGAKQPNNSLPFRSEYYIYLDDKEKNKLLCNVEKLKIGDSYERIVSVVGKTPFDEEIYPKEPWRIRQYGRVARLVSYYTKRYDKDYGENAYDACITLVLDKSNCLDKIEYINIEERCQPNL